LGLSQTQFFISALVKAHWIRFLSGRLANGQVSICRRDQRIELNVFRGNLEGLVLAEVEFPSREKSEEFESPDWFGEEVTGEHPL
jgi:CYTH domain-containing protein